MDTKPVTHGNDIVLTSKPCHQTPPMPYSTEKNRRNLSAKKSRCFGSNVKTAFELLASKGSK